MAQAQQIYEKVVSVISKPPVDRTTEEATELISFFLKKSDLFKSLKTDVVIDIIKNCEFRTTQRDDVIIRQGEKGDCFYIILSGKVAVFISNTIADDDNLGQKIAGLEESESESEGEDDEEDIYKKDNRKVSFTGEPPKKKILDRSKFGNYICPIDAGKSFGEIALISKDCVRNASIICEETTDLIVVNRDLYNRSLRAAQLAEFEERLNFVAENPFFSNWQHKFKRQMGMSVVKVKVPYDGYIVRQGDPVHGLKFVLRGEAMVVVDPVSHETQYPDFYPIAESDFDENLDEELDALLQASKSSRKKKDSHLIPEHDKVLSEPPSASIVKRRKDAADLKRRQVDICVIGAKEVIGDTELANDLKTYTSSIKCLSDCEIFTLDMKNFDRLVTRKNPWTIDKMKKGGEDKLRSRVNRLGDKCVPFLKALLHKIDKAKRKRPNYNNNPVFIKEKTVLDLPQRGPLIDQFGPGTVFYRSRMREKQKQARKGGAGMFKSGWGVSAPMNVGGGIRDSEETLPRLVQIVCQYQQAADSDMRTPSANRGRQSAFLTDAPEEEDYETSNSALYELEERIKTWHAQVEKDQPSLQKNNDPFAYTSGGLRRVFDPEKKVVHLKRFNKENGKKIAPGKKVYIRRRRSGHHHRKTLSDGDEEDDENNHETHRSNTNVKAMSEGCNSRSPSDSDTDNEERTPPVRTQPLLSISPLSPVYGTKKHLLMLKKLTPKRTYTLEEYQELKTELKTTTKRHSRFLLKMS